MGGIDKLLAGSHTAVAAEGCVDCAVAVAVVGAGGHSTAVWDANAKSGVPTLSARVGESVAVGDGQKNLPYRPCDYYDCPRDLAGRAQARQGRTEVLRTHVEGGLVSTH